MAARSMGQVDNANFNVVEIGPRLFNMSVVTCTHTIYKMRAYSITLNTYVSWQSTNPNAGAPSQFGTTQNMSIAEILSS